jgi:hypothetical protein
MAFVAIAIGVGAVASVAGSVISADAASSAADAQANALNSLQTLDISNLSSSASAADMTKYRAGFDAQAKTDPTYAALRTQGASGYLSTLTSDASGTSPADTALNKLGANIDATGKANQSVISQLLDQASKELAAGATLPPEFQQEMVRSGLEGAGGSGLSIDGRGAGGTGIRTLLGSAGIALQRQRQQDASGMLTTASSVNSQQQAALAELSQMSNQLTQSKATRAAGGMAVGNSTVPSIGLSGSDVANLNVANMNAKNNITMAQGQVAGQKDLAQGSMWSGVLNGLGQGAMGLGTLGGSGYFGGGGGKTTTFPGAGGGVIAPKNTAVQGVGGW